MTWNESYFVLHENKSIYIHITKDNVVHSSNNLYVEKPLNCKLKSPEISFKVTEGEQGRIKNLR